MKVKYKELIGNHTIVRIIDDAVVDTVATDKAIAAKFYKEGMTQKEKDSIRREQYELKNFVYAKYGDEVDVIEDSEGAEIRQALSSLEKNQLLLDNGEIIADYRGVEYSIKKSGEWTKERIEDIGVPLPVGAVLEKDLTEEQQAEIVEQWEARRISALTTEQKAKEKTERLHAAAREALNRAEEAELLDETFDKQAFLQPKRAEIELMYA